MDMTRESPKKYIRDTWRIVARCDAGHESSVIVQGVPYAHAVNTAMLMDGTHPLYIHPSGGSAMIGHCSWTTDKSPAPCGNPFHCEVVPVEIKDTGKVTDLGTILVGGHPVTPEKYPPAGMPEKHAGKCEQPPPNSEDVT